MKVIYFLLSITLSAMNLYAWGDNGHRAVGLIAEKHLNPNGRSLKKEILGNEKFARAATWADEIRSDPNFKAIAPYHFMTIPQGSEYHEGDAPQEGDLYVGITNNLQRITDESLSKSERIQSLRLLIHFVGDLHQPLHVGTGSDRGANWCMVKWFGETKNLHEVWDSELFQSLKLSFTEYVDLIRTPNPEEVQTWTNSGLSDWIKESIAIRDTVYPPNKGTKTSLTTDERTYCKKKSSDYIPTDLMPSLSYEYAYQFKPIMETQILKAGIRLASLINKAADAKFQTKEAPTK